jgi:diguanylate cyclase (GGDEF)-like protein/PAS domain S-box-containing protein
MEHLIQLGEFSNQVTPADPGFYRELLDHMRDGVYFVDRERRIQYWSQGAYRLTGYKAEEVVGKCCQDGILGHVDQSGRNLCTAECPLSAAMADGEFHQASLFLRHKQGWRIPVSVQVQPVRGPDGTIVGAIEIFSDDSAQSEARRRTEVMQRLAFLDHLTGLPNRRYLEMALESALVEYQVHKDPLGVMLVDLDGLKEINDAFGHDCGDRALQQMAATLRASLRPTDTVGRWGGDEFLAILRGVSAEALGKLAERSAGLVRRTSVPGGEGRDVALSVSIGAALSHPGETAPELIKRADLLMYRSKAGGRDRSMAE